MQNWLFTLMLYPRCLKDATQNELLFLSFGTNFSNCTSGFLEDILKMIMVESNEDDGFHR